MRCCVPTVLQKRVVPVGGPKGSLIRVCEVKVVYGDGGCPAKIPPRRGVMRLKGLRVD